MSSNTYALGEAGTAGQTTQPNTRGIARSAGVLYLVIIIAGIFAEFFVRSSLIIPGDAAATAEAIRASAGLFRIGIASDLFMIIADIVIGLLFYVLLRPISNTLALMAAFFRLAQAAILGINLLNLFFALQLIADPYYLSVFGAEQVQAFAMLFLNAHKIGYSLGLIFFGVYLFLLGYLLLKVAGVPRILSGLLTLAAIGYLADSFAQVLLSNYAAYADIFIWIVFLPALIAELSLALWLLVKGID